MEGDLNGLCPSRTLLVLLKDIFTLSFKSSYTKKGYFDFLLVTLLSTEVMKLADKLKVITISLICGKATSQSHLLYRKSDKAKNF